MMDRETVQVRVVVNVGEDAQERADLTGKLRRQLLKLDVDRVDLPKTGDVPPDARGLGLAEIGTLVVTCGKGASALASLVAAVQSWVMARGTGTVKLQMGGDVIEVTGTLSPEQKTIVDLWIKAHAAR